MLKIDWKDSEPDGGGEKKKKIQQFHSIYYYFVHVIIIIIHLPYSSSIFILHHVANK